MIQVFRTAVPALLVREVSYLERAAQQPEAQPAKLARQVSAKPCRRMKLPKPLGIVSPIGASNSRSRSVTTVFGALQEPICYGSVSGTARADLLRHCLGYYRS